MAVGEWMISLQEVFSRMRYLSRDRVLADLPIFTTVASNNSFNLKSNEETSLFSLMLEHLSLVALLSTVEKPWLFQGSV